MKSYHDIVGDGGSNVVGQVEALHGAIAGALSGVRHRLAVGSGKGGVGKSTVTYSLAKALRRQGKSIAILDADFNGPCQAHLAGLDAAPWIPGADGLMLPVNAEGIGVASFGSLLPASKPMEIDSVSQGEEQTWRGMREFAMLGQMLSSIDWGTLDMLLFDLPPGAERTRQYAHFFGETTPFVLVTLPSELSHSVVSRSISALSDCPNPILGVIENMAGYYCSDCDEIKPLFTSSVGELAVPTLGSIPFDPALANPGASPETPSSDHPSTRAFDAIARRILEDLES